jgi:demethoxyubiquinone hydroxylase (CLK1/Coq7/Cat5 family)
MMPNVSVRTYRPRQQAAPRETRREKPRNGLGLSAETRKYLAIMVAVALVAGLVVTQFFYGQMMDMRSRAEQLRGLNTSVYNENVRLLAFRAQLASRSHVAALAGTKLNLYEPDKGQVRRM